MTQRTTDVAECCHCKTLGALCYPHWVQAGRPRHMSVPRTGPSARPLDSHEMVVSGNPASQQQEV